MLYIYIYLCASLFAAFVPLFLVVPSSQRFSLMVSLFSLYCALSILDSILDLPVSFLDLFAFWTDILDFILACLETSGFAFY